MQAMAQVRSVARITVLVVDEAQSNLESMQQALKQKGYGVRITSNPERADRLARQVQVALVAPERGADSPLSVVRQLRESGFKGPIFLMSTNLEHKMFVGLGNTLKIAGFYLKPVGDLDGLDQDIKNAVRSGQE